MTDKQVNRWLRRQFSLVGWILVAYYGMMTLVASAAMWLEEVKQMLPGQNFDLAAIYGNAWGYVLAVLMGLIILHAWKGGNYWREEIFAREDRMRPGVFFCMLLFCMGAQLVNSLWISVVEASLNVFGKSAMELLESVAGDSDTFSMFLYASILAPIGEEILFRGYVLRSLRPYGKRFAVLGSAVLFGLFHGNLLQTPYAILMGLVLGYVAVEYSVIWSIALHMFNNLVLADLLTRLTMNWSDLAYGALNLLLLGGSFLTSLVILVRNRRQIRDYRKSEWIDRRCMKCCFTSGGVLVLMMVALMNMASLFFE